MCLPFYLIHAVKIVDNKHTQKEIISRIVVKLTTKANDNSEPKSLKSYWSWFDDIEINDFLELCKFYLIGLSIFIEKQFRSFFHHDNSFNVIIAFFFCSDKLSTLISMRYKRVITHYIIMYQFLKRVTLVIKLIVVPHICGYKSM